MTDVYNPYEKYGVRRVINAAGTLTRVGGSISPPEVFKAMEDASKCFVHIPELQSWAGKVIAEAMGAEAGLPTAGSIRRRLNGPRKGQTRREAGTQSHGSNAT